MARSADIKASVERQGGVVAPERRPETGDAATGHVTTGRGGRAPAADAASTEPLFLDLSENPRGGSASYDPRRSHTSPGSANAGNRLFFVILFWFALAASVEVWWLHNPKGSITDAGSALIAAGRITGMVGGFVLLAEVLMMSRVAWLEQWVGAHDLLIWHRSLGGFLVILVPAHAVLTVFGYAMSANTSVTHETWTMLTTYEDMISAFVATGILVALGALAIRAVRRRMPYELWYYLHLTTYLVLLLGYGHQFAVGADLAQGGFAQWYWAGLYAFVLVCLAWGRVLEPLWLNLRHRFRVVDVVPEAPGMVSVYVGGRHLGKLDAQAGQYFRWRFLTRGNWWQAHPFSLSAAPNSDWLRLTIKVVGDHTRSLQYLKPGDRVFAEGPSGAFTADRRVRPGALLIAGGSGIAPIRALLEDLPRGTVVLYRASSADDIVFREELDALARERGAYVWYVLGARDDPGPRRLFSPAGMRELIPDVRRRDVYMCGPDGLIALSHKVLRRLRVPRRQIHLDPFEF
jgi:predicted ferric reductase